MSDYWHPIEGVIQSSWFHCRVHKSLINMTSIQNGNNKKVNQCLAWALFLASRNRAGDH